VYCFDDVSMAVGICLIKLAYTHIRETGSRSRLQKSALSLRRQILAPVFRAAAQLQTSLTAMLEVMHRQEKLAPEYSAEFRRMVPISGACAKVLRYINEKMRKQICFDFCCMEFMT